MTRFTFTVLCAAFFLTTRGQADKLPVAGPGFYFNSFQAYSSNNVDSSLYYARLLAAEPKYGGMLQDLLHNAFAQSFQKKWEREEKDSARRNGLKNGTILSRKILEGMVADSNRQLAATVRPIHLWVQVQQHAQDDRALARLTRAFLDTALLVPDLYANRSARYAFLVHQVIAKRKALQPLADRLLAVTLQQLKAGLAAADTASRSMQERRVWYKYLYAYGSFVKAGQLSAQKKEKAAAAWLKTASDHSPGLADKQYASGYFYDMYFLFEKEKATFQDDYVRFLTRNSSNNQETLATLKSLALTNPGFKGYLQSFYDTHFSGAEAFGSFWTRSINETALPLLHFSLKQLDGHTFSTANLRGRWALVDFWGTWCAPCRKEHPDLQQLYRSFAAPDTGRLVLLTIACADQENAVNAYMAQHRYSFPVAMADNRIEKLYRVSSYPSKLLITPQGKYLVIPFGIDWVDFVRKYADL